MTSVSGTHLVELLDQLIEPIKKELKKKVDKSAIQQAQERQLELKRSALRAVAAISGIVPNADGNAKLKDLVDTVIVGTLKEQYETILHDFTISQDVPL